jgi:sugar (pentulose or hexulose) kinase
MMHGYLPFNEKGELLADFRTWRNTITGEAADKLTKEFNFNIPQRWSIAHLYQSILNVKSTLKILHTSQHLQVLSILFLQAKRFSVSVKHQVCSL